MDFAFGKPIDSPERGHLPLWPVSPSRENRLPTSPSLPSVSPTRNGHDRFAASHTRSGSDVQNKVAAFNNLTREAAQRKRDNEAALRRAVLGREEAESEARRLKDENDALRRDIEEGRGRETKVGERLENVMEELQRVKQNQAQVQTVYEKEVRRARKEAFKSSSALVNLQEELKTARNRFTLMRVEAEDERQKSRTKEQDIAAKRQQLLVMEEQLDSLKQQSSSVKENDNSSAQQELEAVRDELSMLKQQKTTSSILDPVNSKDELREVSEELFILQQQLSKAQRKMEKLEMQKQVVEEERDALKQSMEEEQVARRAAQGAIALPPRPEEATASPGSRRPSSRDDAGRVEHNRNMTQGLLAEIEVADELSQLRLELNLEKRMRREAEEQVHLSLMECQFGCCSCRVAEKSGTPFVHDGSLAQEILELATGCKSRRNDALSTTKSPERLRIHQGPGRSNTPGLAMPQRPRSQQALGRQATPKLLERPHSQQAESRRITPRPPQHNRSVTETTFKTARELDLQARRSICQARNPSATPTSPPKTQQLPEFPIDSVLKADNSNEEVGADTERMPDIDFTSPHPQPFTQEDTVHHILSPSPPADALPPSPTMDFNFTEIIPNIPSIPHPFPTPPPAEIHHSPPTAARQEFSICASTITTIPINDGASKLFSPAPDTPGGISREEALEQIRARRGRARSYAASHGAPTPKKGLTGTPRREISAPAIRRL